MNKYVVSHFSLMNGELLAEIVEAASKLEAALKYLNLEEVNITTQAELNEYLANVEDWVVVTDISNNRAGTGRPGGGLQTRISQFNSESRVQ